jgi:nucleotide-binding universal stress UspA family protein
MSIKTILVPTDFSEGARAAFQKACEMARQLGANLHLLHVRDESTLRIAIKEGLLDADSTDEQLKEAVENLTEERFTKLLSEVDTSGVRIERASRRGDADAAIVDYAREIHADIIVAGRRGAGLMDKIMSAVLGSVTASLIGKSPCPVLIVRREHARPGDAATG